MKILIAYATKSGTTEDCAKMLADHFPGHEISVQDLGRDFPRVSEYDAVIVGSHVRMGKIHKKVGQFLKENQAALGERRFGLYLCCNFADKAEQYFEKNFPPQLLSSAVATLGFGGEVRLERLRGLDKFIMKAVIGFIKSNNRDEDRDRDIPLPALLPENIRRMADAIKQG